MAVLQWCVWLLAEMHSSRSVFNLNNHKSGVNRYLWFCQFPKNAEVCRIGCVLFIKPWHHTLHISELKYVPTHGTFPSFFEIDKTAGAYSLQIYDYLSQIQLKTNAFLLIVRHSTEGPAFFDWLRRHRTLFFFVGLKNQVNLVLFFKPWCWLSMEKANIGCWWRTLFTLCVCLCLSVSLSLPFHCIVYSVLYTFICNSCLVHLATQLLYLLVI